MTVGELKKVLYDNFYDSDLVVLEYPEWDYRDVRAVTPLSLSIGTRTIDGQYVQDDAGSISAVLIR